MKRVFDSIYSDEEEDDPLQKQFKTLEIEWNSIKQSISRSDRRNSTTNGDHRLFQQYDDSPKELMSLLQNDNPPSKSFFPNSEHHDQAAIDIIEQRAVDFDNGRLKGRRLFEELEVGSNDNGGINGVCFDVDEQSDVCTEYSCMSFENNDGICNRNYVGSRRSVGRLMICVVVMLALAIVVFICSGEGEQILVPT